MMCTFFVEVSLTRIFCTSSIQSPDATTQHEVLVSRGIVEATTTDATATAEATTTSVSLIRL